MKIESKFEAALFDLDGVVFDTEPQYTVFWGGECRRYHPEIPDLEYKIKGQTLTEIYDRYFSDVKDEQKSITRRLNEFEQTMKFNYITGFQQYIENLRRHDVKTAVVTSSNNQKMQAVYASHPEFKTIFDMILTSESFSESKPSPECYITASKKFCLDADHCVVFEDSFNGLKSGRAALMTVVGLSTTNPADALLPLSDYVISDYNQLTYQKTCELVNQNTALK